MVGLGRLELPTSPLSGVRSNQLSYKPFLLLLFALCFALVFHSLGYVLPVHALARSKVGSPRTKIIAINDDFAALRICLNFPSTSFCSFFINNKTICVNTQSNKIQLNSKEVIQPQVPLGLPCYDFTPVMKHKVVIVLPKVRLTTSFASHSHGVTGGVYKARERIHRSMLTCDY